MDSLKAYRDAKNSIDTALEKGREEGMVKGMEKEKDSHSSPPPFNGSF